MSTSLKDIYLVVGGSGFLGRHIVKALKARGDEVSVFDIVQRHDDVPFYVGDISEPGVFSSAVEKSGATCIVHTASPMPGLKDSTIYTRVNVEGTQNIIDAAIRSNVPKLVFTSSAGVVFMGDDLENASEDTPYPTVAMDVYNETKAIAERLVMAANGRNGLSTVVLRPAGIFGPEDRQALQGFVTAYKTQKTHIQIGNNKNLYDWTYIDNLVHAHLLAADKLSPTSGVAGEIFFITNGDPIPFWDFPHKLWAHLAEAGIEPVPTRKVVAMPRIVGLFIGLVAEIMGWITGKDPLFTRYRVKFTCATRWHNISKARRILGYEPLISNDEGIKRSADWWIKEHAT